MNGGVDTGFRHVERGKYEPRFFIVKKVGRRTEVKQIPMRLKNLNSGDVFIMDLGLTIYQFNGQHCSKVRNYDKHQSRTGNYDSMYTLTAQKQKFITKD